ncbi:MAG: phosphoribosylformylglycinamidine synthase I [Alphaproteobacteria bacterium CG11_big_fil_rev_8_21_14_0_20_39_49]|nr:MAG: phosphoribosylformylglycinamidine synthase I [Alphaproteobacteria bacterium CG11_big_fil_rev_8_21_14_0_20_39_49]
MKAAVITFPGSNCDRDMYETIESISGIEVKKIWHADTELPKGLDFIALPGGFSYGDYLRSGAMSAKSPIMNEVVKAAKKGTYILGVCNGFQILTEAGLLPGTLMRNKNLKFICKTVELAVENNDSEFTKTYHKGQHIQIPIAHHDGNFYADEDTLKEIEDSGRVAFRYAGENPNGSINNIAGVFSENKRILGMMPHPERAADEITGNTDGQALFEALVSSF